RRGKRKTERQDLGIDEDLPSRKPRKTKGGGKRTRAPPYRLCAGEFVTCPPEKESSEQEAVMRVPLGRQERTAAAVQRVTSNPPCRLPRAGARDRSPVDVGRRTHPPSGA